MDLVVTGVVAGVLGTLAMDSLNLLFTRTGMIAKIDVGMIGRMSVGWARGRFRYGHPSEMKQAANETLYGYATHYAIGVSLALVYVLGWDRFVGGPASPIWALAYGVATTVASYFFVFPSMGFGVFGRRSPEGIRAPLSALANHLFFGVGLAVGVALLASSAEAEPGQAERMVDIGTHALHIRVMGAGAPAVVFDAGIAARSEEWHTLQARLAEETRVFIYDRAGYGASAPGPLPRDSGREAEELRSLLQASGVEGPYVLVGHSLGGLNVQVFAARYPEDVAGIVLLDPPPLGWLRGERYSDLFAMAEQMTDEWQAIGARGAESSDPGDRAESDFFRMIASEHREMLGESARLVADIETFGDIPLVVIASGAPNPSFGEVANEYQAYWADQSRAVASKSSRGEFLLAEDSTHRLHEDAADLILESILSVMAEARTR